MVFIFTKNASLTLKVSFHRLAHCCAIFLWATNYSWVTFQLICHWRILSGVNPKCAGWSPDVKSRKGQSSRNQQSFPADLANCLFLLPGNIRRTTWNFVFVIYMYMLRPAIFLLGDVYNLYCIQNVPGLDRGDLFSRISKWMYRCRSIFLIIP